MLRLQCLRFRTATDNDIHAVIDIHNSNVRGQPTAQEHSFLLATITEATVQESLSRGTQHFVAVGSKDQVLGFLVVSKPTISESLLNHIVWKDDTARHKLVSDRHRYIQTIAIKPTYRGQGIGQWMYRSFYETFPQAIFSAFVVMKPIFNERSMLFHQKQGFHHVGTVHHDLFLDLENYESALMLKYPQSG